MKIGTYYRLPDGRKGLYVGITKQGMNAFSAEDDHGFLYHHYSHPAQDYEEYVEPRVFEDEVLLVSINGSEPEFIFKADLARDHKIHARMLFKLPEGEGL